MKRLPGIASAPLPHRDCRGVISRLALAFLPAWLAGSISPARAAEPVWPSYTGPSTNLDLSLPKHYQAVSQGAPPRSPAEFSPDSGVPPFRPQLFEKSDLELHLMRHRSQSEPLPPAVFNPDPGAAFRSQPVERSFYTNDFSLLPDYNGQPVPAGLDLPRTNVTGNALVPVEPALAPPYGSEPLTGALKLPRPDTRSNSIIDYKWNNPDYPLSRQGKGYPPDSEPEPDRWRIGFAPWRRYTSGTTETPYETPETMLWHPYKQSLLKGDAPIIGQNIFLNLTAGSEIREFRRPPRAHRQRHQRVATELRRVLRPERADFGGQ